MDHKSFKNLIEVSKFLSLGLGALSHFLGHGVVGRFIPRVLPLHTSTHNPNEKEEMTSKKEEMLLVI